jgi:hypothetical protein
VSCGFTKAQVGAAVSGRYCEGRFAKFRNDLMSSKHLTSETQRVAVDWESACKVFVYSLALSEATVRAACSW